MCAGAPSYLTWDPFPKLFEKGYEQRSEREFDQYKEDEMG